jgi:NAD(P)H-nitrite reductase large subunit
MARHGWHDGCIWRRRRRLISVQALVALHAASQAAPPLPGQAPRRIASYRACDDAYAMRRRRRARGGGGGARARTSA